MLSNMPFFRRVALPITARPGYYVAAMLIGGIGMALLDRADALVTFYIGITSLFVGFVSMRTVDDDHATDTLEQLDVLPVPRWRMALEIAAGAVVGFGVLATLATVISAFGVRGHWDLAFLWNQLPVIPAMALLGTIVPLRHRMRLPAMAVMLAVLVFTVKCVAPDVQHALSPKGALAAFAMMPVKLAAWLALWGLLWKLAHALGGGWTGGDAFQGSHRASKCASSCPMSRGTPDNWNPLFWRELKQNRLFLFVLWSLGALYIATVHRGQYYYDSPTSAFTTCLAWVGFGLCMFSAMRTSHDRLSGMWADLAYTPVALSSVLWCRVRGMFIQSAMMILGWLAVTAVVDPGNVCALVSDGPIPVLMLAAGYLAAVLAGFASGTSGRGVIAGIGGLFLMYFLMLASMMPFGLLVSFGRDHGGPDPVLAAIGAILGGITFYGALIGMSLRAIRSAAEEQRA